METRTKVLIGIACCGAVIFLISLWGGSQEALDRFDEVCPPKYGAEVCKAAQQEHDLRCRHMSQAQSQLPRSMRRFRIFENKISPHHYVSCITGAIETDLRKERLKEQGYSQDGSPPAQ